MLMAILLLMIAFPTPALGQQSSEEDLAKKTQNPIADLISVPLQSNFYFGAGLHHNKMIYVLDVQPVIPVNISDDWNVITRTIMPIINHFSRRCEKQALVICISARGFRSIPGSGRPAALL